MQVVVVVWGLAVVLFPPFTPADLVQKTSRFAKKSSIRSFNCKKPMTYHPLHPLPVSIFLLWNYYIRTVDSFHIVWRSGSLHGFNINVLTKINRFDDLPWHDLHRRNPIPYYEQHIRKIDGMYSGCHGRATFQLYAKKASSDDTSFDFSSKMGWEEYYKRGLIVDYNNNDGSSSSPSITTEWHTSIPLETISSYCWGDYAKNCKINDRYDDDTNSMNQSFLMIGCGTSHLVEVIMEGNPCNNNTKSDNVQFTLLDSSQTCIDELTSRYKQFENIHCVCGEIGRAHV